MHDVRVSLHVHQPLHLTEAREAGQFVCAYCACGTKLERKKEEPKFKGEEPTLTEPLLHTRPTSLRPRSTSITCSARSFASASSSVWPAAKAAKAAAAEAGSEYRRCVWVVGGQERYG